MCFTSTPHRQTSQGTCKQRDCFRTGNSGQDPTQSACRLLEFPQARNLHMKVQEHGNTISNPKGERRSAPLACRPVGLRTSRGPVPNETFQKKKMAVAQISVTTAQRDTFESIWVHTNICGLTQNPRSIFGSFITCPVQSDDQVPTNKFKYRHRKLQYNAQ